jgi:phage terminase small subunit
MSRLTNLQKEFVNQYFLCGLNATEAVVKAGYKVKNRAVAAAIGYENLRKPQISEAIEERLGESAMGANEVLYRLSEHARGNVGDYLDMFGVPSIDKAKSSGKIHLIKKLKTKTYFVGEDRVVETEMELYDAQSALVQLGRFHKLFTDKVEYVDWRGEAIASIRANEIDYPSLAEEFGDELATTLFREAGIPIAAAKA